MLPTDEDTEVLDDNSHFQNQVPAYTDMSSIPTAYHIQVKQSPYMTAFYGHYVACLTIDSGATGNMICLSTAKMLRVDISRSSQYAHQADGLSPVRIGGETHFTVVKDTIMNSWFRD